MRCSARLRARALALFPPPLAHAHAAVAVLLYALVLCNAGPIERNSRMIGNGVPLDSNATSAQMGEACAVGDVVYMPGDTVPGSIPCELCICGSAGGVQCEPIECEMKPGCKALHRPDHCCPLYQCECEENGRKYANGEKLVDPVDPCRVCYCQGGVVVCSRLACFHRDDCDPRYVDKQCCPKYDHCPPREHKIRATDNSTNSITKPQFSLDSNTDEGNTLRQSSEPFEIGREVEAKDSKMIDKSNVTSNKINEIRIKEVTQKMEIPADTGIRIKEVHPLINREINQYTVGSTKGPLSAREVDYDFQSPIKDTTTDNLINETQNINKSLNSAYPSPPVLRIGDQLLFLKVGDLMPEPDSLSTPATVITVFGAEGLIRGEENEFTENETNYESENKEDGTFKSQTTNEENGNSVMPTTISLLYNDTHPSSSLETFQENEMTDVTSSHDITEMTLTSETTEKTSIEDSPKLTNKNSFLSIDGNYSNEQTQETSTVKESLASQEVSTVDIFQTEIAHDTEITTVEGTDYDGTTELQSQPQQRKYETKIVVKRPILSAPNTKTIQTDKPSKILSYLKHNDSANASTSTTAPLIPLDWLKSTNPPHHVSNSNPMLNLNGVLSDEILSTTSSTEIKDGVDYNLETDKDEHESDAMGSDELLIELRAPGEPLLIPEWDKNIRSNDITTNGVSEITTFDYTTTINNLKTETFEANTVQQSTINPELNNYVFNTQLPNTDSNDNNFKIIVSEPYNNQVVNSQNYDTSTVDTLKISDSFSTEEFKKLTTDSTQISTNDNSEAADNDFTTFSYKNIHLASTTIPEAESESLTTSSSSESDISDEKIKNKSNILADLISLVGDVASIGNHNDQDGPSKKSHNNIVNYNDKEKEADKKALEFSYINEGKVKRIELSDITPMEDHDLPSEHKVEPTTQKPIIDRVSHTHQNGSVVDTNDIEIILKVESSKPSDNEPKKIVQDPSYNNMPRSFESKANKNQVPNQTSTVQNDYELPSTIISKSASETISTHPANVDDESVTRKLPVTESDLSAKESHRLVNNSNDSEI